MNFITILFVFILFQSCSPQKKTEAEKHLQIDCRILDQDLKLLKSFTGNYCAFFPNGEWISITGKELKLFSKNNQLKYRFKEMGHHEVRLSNDQKRIYFLSSEIRNFKNKKTRFDVINIADTEGKILARWDLFDHIDELYKLLELSSLDFALPAERPDETFPDIKYEFSHVNSIYEIPANELQSRFPYMKKGNLLVTFNGLSSVVIFDPELKNIKFVYRVLKTNLLGIHDGQILPNGHLLIFKNYNDPIDAPFTSINEFDMQNDLSVWSYVFKTPELDYNPHSGSVQMLESGNVFFTDYSHGLGKMVEIERSGKVVKLVANNILDPKTSLPLNMYRAKKINLDSFLNNNF